VDAKITITTSMNPDVEENVRVIVNVTVPDIVIGLDGVEVPQDLPI